MTSAAVLRLLRADPLLPTALLPEDWPGAALRTVLRRLRHRVAATAAGVLHADARPPFPASRTRTQPGSARTSSCRRVTLGVAEHLGGEHLGSICSGTVSTTGPWATSRTTLRSTRSKAGWKQTAAEAMGS